MTTGKRKSLLSNTTTDADDAVVAPPPSKKRNEPGWDLRSGVTPYGQIRHCMCLQPRACRAIMQRWCRIKEGEGRVGYVNVPEAAKKAKHTANARHAGAFRRGVFRYMYGEDYVVDEETGDDNNNNNNRRTEHHSYAEPNCPFTSRGYNSVLSEIANRAPDSPLLLVYLHSPLHGDGTNFIRKYLCHPQLLQLLNANSTGGDDTSAGNEGNGTVVCWGASVHTADGQRVRDMMDVTSFPFMALLNVKPNRSNSSEDSRNNNNNNNSANVTMELLLRMEGPQIMTIPPAQITTYLSTSISRHAELLAQAEAQRLQRQEEIRLREEQDREYQEALLADQIREIEQREREERERREEEERVELERLAGEKDRRRLADAMELMEKCVEPAVGSKGMARLRFTLPNGKKVDRRFQSLDTMEVVKAFLIVHFNEQEVEMKNFGLSTNFPKKTFGEEDDNKTLEELGLAPQAVVMVQDLDA
mmetsp:Transcript_14567/g.31397  ORF Transcript_14567/g.31397 Transcript_14567/m.31397 type:complete len:474 (+) Transcript_14567:170-1591(+)